MNIQLFVKAPSRSVHNQILKMVADFHTELSMMGLQPSNPLYDLYNWILVQEVDAYLNRVGLLPEIPVELAVAFDDASPEKVLGFLLYLPVASHPEACAINYMAVDASCRRQGIGSALMATVVERYPHTELTCFVDKVPFYERLGFRPLAVRHTQVVMNTRDQSTTGQIRVVSADHIAASPEARIRHDGLVARWGRKTMKDAHAKMARHVDRLAARAVAFMQARPTNL